MNRILIGIINSFTSLSILSSCAIYKQDFDCPPPTGVPCTSETELEAMIVETDKGPDLFIPVNKKTMFKEETKSCQPIRKVWISNQENDSGCAVQGHYIYQVKEV